MVEPDLAQGVAQLITRTLPDAVHGTVGADLAPGRAGDAIVEVDFTDHGFDHVEQADGGRTFTEEETAPRSLADFDQTGSGEILGDFGKKMGGNVRLFGNFLTADQRSPCPCRDR